MAEQEKSTCPYCGGKGFEGADWTGVDEETRENWLAEWQQTIDEALTLKGQQERERAAKEVEEFLGRILTELPAAIRNLEDE